MFSWDSLVEDVEAAYREAMKRYTGGFVMRLEEVIEICRDLGDEVREMVRPHLGEKPAREMQGRGASGDSTFAIDEVAEEQGGEQAGGASPGWPISPRTAVWWARMKRSWVLVVDPIDGTRPAAAGLEACCVSIAVAEYHPDRQAPSHPRRRGLRPAAGDKERRLVRGGAGQGQPYGHRWGGEERST